MKHFMPAGTDGLRRARLAMLAGLFAINLAACDRNRSASSEAPAPGPAERSMTATDHEAMDHGHAMTPGQFTELREKIPLYKAFSDEQIMENMGRMPPDFWSLISSEDMQGEIGVLALGHGYKLGGNEQFENYAGPIAKVHPTAVAPGMAMMSSSHIQEAIDELTGKHGVRTIVAVPMEPADDSTLIRQWQYIFGLREEAPFLSVPRVTTDARIVLTKSPATDPRMARIMGDHGLEVSASPESDRLILVSHGPEKPEDNPAELVRLEKHAADIRRNTSFGDIKVVSVQDDAVPEVRAARIADLRRYVQEATDEGRDAVIVPMILTKGGFHVRLQKDLDGLDFRFANRGLIEHPAFQEWISATVRDASGSP